MTHLEDKKENGWLLSGKIMLYLFVFLMSVAVFFELLANNVYMTVCFAVGFLSAIFFGNGGNTAAALLMMILSLTVGWIFALN